MTRRAVTVWQWRRLLRDHWPADKGALLTLYTLSTYMDGKGAFAWPTIDTLAEKTGQAERTVRRHISRALELGYLATFKSRARNGGQGWRRTYYQAHVPDTIELSEEDSKLANTVGSIDSEAALVEREPTTEQPYAYAHLRARSETPSTGATTGHQAPKGRTSERKGAVTGSGTTGQQRHEGPDIRGADSPVNGTTGQIAPPIGTKPPENPLFRLVEGADTSNGKGPDTRTHKSSFKSSSQVSNSSIQREATAGAADAHTKTILKNREDPEEERQRKALVLLRNSPEVSDAHLNRWYGVTPEKAADLRREAAGTKTRESIE